MNKFNCNRNGLTLVELLVAIAILSIVVALIVPRLRIVNKDRNVREAARVIGAKFSAARDAAVNNGNGGIVIERNTNFVTQTNANNRVFFAGTRLTEMKATPPYSGDSGNDFVFYMLVNRGTIAAPDFYVRGFIPMPFEHDLSENRLVVEPFDTIQLGSSNTQYLINNVVEVPRVSFNFDGGRPIINGMEIQGDDLRMLAFDLEFEVGVVATSTPPVPNLYAPDPRTGATLPPLCDPVPADEDVYWLFEPNAGGPFGGSNVGPLLATELNEQSGFVINRQPRKVQSSAVNLPDGYIIDLRYSGPSDPAGDPSDPGYDPTLGPEALLLPSGRDDPDTSTVFGLAIDQAADPQVNLNKEIEIHFNGEGSIDRIVYNGISSPISQSLYLFVDEYDPNQFVAGEPSLLAAQKALAGDSSLWVTIGANGGTNIGYNSPPANFTTVRDLISQSRIIARERTDAAQ